MFNHLPEKIGVVGVAIILAWVACIVSGCDSWSRDYKWTSGKEVAYCIIEDTPPSRLLCVNSRLMKENPLFGVKQGEFPYVIASSKEWFYSCYCNPDLVTIEKNQQQGTVFKK